MKLLETACSLYEASADTEQKQEIQRFLIQKVRKILLKFTSYDYYINIFVMEKVYYALKRHGTAFERTLK